MFADEEMLDVEDEEEKEAIKEFERRMQNLKHDLEQKEDIGAEFSPLAYQKDSEDVAHFRSELAWREFSYYLLLHFDGFAVENFNAKLRSFCVPDDALDNVGPWLEESCATRMFMFTAAL